MAASSRSGPARTARGWHWRVPQEAVPQQHHLHADAACDPGGASWEPSQVSVVLLGALGRVVCAGAWRAGPPSSTPSEEAAVGSPGALSRDRAGGSSAQP